MSPQVVRLQTARAWGKAPSEFAALPYEDKLYMTALTRAESMMRAWERQVSEDEMKKARRSGKAPRYRP
jgi:hypothetical protein